MRNDARLAPGLLIAGFVLASCTSSDTNSTTADSEASGSTSTATDVAVSQHPMPSPAPAEPTAAPTPIEEPTACGAEDTPLVASYRLATGQCPSANQLEELTYVWEQNREFWRDFPAQLTSFAEVNFGKDGHVLRDDLAGLSISQASALLTSDATFPMTLDLGPVQQGTMTLYEFSGGLTLLLVVERDDVVMRVYTFDLV